MTAYTELAARQALASLIGRLLLAPPAAELWAEAAALPELAAVMGDGPEELAVAYEYLFGRNVYPYESLYRDEELMLNTAAADRVAAFYTACGYEPDPNVGAPDHLGLELTALARLIATEAAAQAHGDAALRGWARRQAAALVRQHLAGWAPIWARAVQRIPAHPFYQTLASLVVELIGSELERLAGEPVAMQEYIPLQPATPHDEETDLNALIRYLITPVKAGFFLSRADCSALARQLGFAIPISDRFNMARTLFETAGQFEQVKALITALQDIMSNEEQELRRLIDAQAVWEPALRPWLARLADRRWLSDA